MPSPSTTTKASVKEDKGNKEGKFSPFLGSIEWKKEWDSDKSKIVRANELPIQTHKEPVVLENY